MIRCDTRVVGTSKGIIVLRTIMTRRAQQILRQQGDIKDLTEFMLSQHCDHIREMISIDRADVKSQLPHLNQLHPHTGITQGVGLPFMVDMVSRIAKVEKRRLRKDRLYWNAIICAPSEKQAALAELEKRMSTPPASHQNKSATLSQMNETGELQAGPEVNWAPISPETKDKNANNIRPQPLPFSRPSLRFMTPDDFENFQSLSASMPELKQSQMRMRDDVAANLIMFNHFATLKSTFVMPGEDPQANAREKLALWTEYARQIGVSNENLQRAKDAFENGKIAYSLLDNAFIIVD